MSLGNTPEKIIFLNIDGVMTTRESLRGTALTSHKTAHSLLSSHISPAKVIMMRGLCHRTGAKIVVTSTWRKFKMHMAAFGSVWEDCPFHEDWRTADLSRQMGPIWSAPGRGTEIRDWVDRHPEISSMVVIDDEISDIITDISSQVVVKTNFEDGIKGHDLQRAESILDRTGVPWFVAVDQMAGE